MILSALCVAVMRPRIYLCAGWGIQYIPLFRRRRGHSGRRLFPGTTPPSPPPSAFAEFWRFWFKAIYRNFRPLAPNPLVITWASGGSAFIALRLHVRLAPISLSPFAKRSFWICDLEVGLFDLPICPIRAVEAGWSFPLAIRCVSILSLVGGSSTYDPHLLRIRPPQCAHGLRDADPRRCPKPSLFAATYILDMWSFLAIGCI